MNNNTYDNRIAMDIDHINEEAFIQLCRKNNPRHFTRKRKFPLLPLVLSVPFRKGKTLYMELRHFKEVFNMDSQISKPGYLYQRKKLNPLALHELMQFHAKNFFSDNSSVKLWKNRFLLLSVDGSSANVPLTKENIETYGSVSGKGKPRPQMGISCMFEVNNHMVLDMSINNCKFDERKCALKHIESCKQLVQGYDSIHLFDRGYPSGGFLITLTEKKLNFVIRLGSSSFKKEQLSMKSDDEWIDIVFDKSRLNAAKQKEDQNDYEKMKAAGSIRLRFVRVKLSTGETEYLVTNMDSNMVPASDMKELYHMRWGIETAYDEMKNRMQLENFSGSTPVIMEQDVYATGYLFNVIHDMIQDAEQSIVQPENGYKHKMQINTNLAIGIIKTDLLKTLLEQDPEKKKMMFQSMIEEIRRNLVPVRDDRQYARNKGNLASKYCNTRKSSY